MAEEGSVYELEGLEKQLESLLSRYSSEDLRADSKPFCSDFCKLVEEYASRWQVPLPQLRIFEVAVCYLARASTFFASNCDHVLHTLSSLALSVFELLLFFDQKDFHQEPLKQFTVTFQECHDLALARHQNVHLLQVERLVQGGGPWAGPALQAILSESSLPQSEVDGCISSELPVFFELRVRYLLSCERVSEAIALAKCCAGHPTTGQHLFFLQVYLTRLCKTSQHDRLHKEVAEFNGKDAIHIICSLECEEKDELLLSLSRAFLSQQLRRGDMYYLCDLVFIWSKLHSRLNTSKQALLEESRQLMLSATNVNSIFPFIRAILQELGEDGIQFCVELCANALGSCLPCDVVTKSLIYKTIAGLLPNDLEVARACALLIFFLERTVETYKMVYLLYMHPDQEYHAEHSPIANDVRFETLQVLKKDLYFDPEFWNLIALRTNCLKLMSEKAVALEEVMEDKWIAGYCTKEPASRSSTSACQKGGKKRHLKEEADAASKRLKMGPGRPRLNIDHAGKKRGSRLLKDASSEPLRRSFWQLDRLQNNVAGERRRTTRLSEKNPPKRRIRTPKWLLEDSGTLGENKAHQKIKRHGLKHQKHHESSVIKRSETGELKNNPKPSVNSHLMTRKNSVKPAAVPQVILELSLPDNELLGTFPEDACNRQRGLPQVLLYRPTVKVPATSQPAKPVHRKEVILRARDAAMLIQQVHCYARRQKGKGNVPTIQCSASTITRSSVQGSPPKELCERAAAEMKGGVTSQAPAAAEATESAVQTTKAVSRKSISGRDLTKKSVAAETSGDVTEAPMLDKVLQAQTRAKELCEESAVEMKVTIASTAAKVTQSPGLDKVSKAPKTTTSAQTSDSQVEATDKTLPVPTSVSNTADPTPSQSQDVRRDTKQEQKSHPTQAETGKSPEVEAKAGKNSISEPKLSKGPCENDTSKGTTVTTSTPTAQDSINDISSLTLVTEMVTELAPQDLEIQSQTAQEDSTSKKSTAGSKSKAPHKSHSTSKCSVVADAQGREEEPWDFDPEMHDASDIPESEESKLEYCCTFCHKEFKGTRVVAHAMFHYRKDECMFCGTRFKDDLLAMMHLSDHIEKLKRIKEAAASKAQENQVDETKDISTPKSSAKAKTANMSSERRSSGRHQKSTESASRPDSTPSGSRELRSNGKPGNASSKEKKESEHLISKTVHKVNGHISVKKKRGRPRKDNGNSEARPVALQISQKRSIDKAEKPRLQEIKEKEMKSSVTQVKVHTKFGFSAKHKMKTTKQSGKVEQKRVETQEKVCCPLEGCAWFTDSSKNRVALLYHALEDHYGEISPLKLAFRIADGKCSSCMRVMWSFEHFRHHVERHRLTPRHPCLHRGCAARFKSGMEMRRHARRHSPLQAVCCRPGCSKLFICLWALNLHEREHYGSKPDNSDKDRFEKTGDKHENAPDSKKQRDHSPKDATTTVNKTVTVKSTRKLREATTERHTQAPPRTSVVAPLLKQRKGTKDSHVLKNLSNKDTSTQPTGPILRLRQTLRKVTNTSHKVISSSLPKHNIKVRRKFKKKQVKVNTKGLKRRGRPPKAKVVHDENITNGQSSQKHAAETSNVRNKSKEEEKVKRTETINDDAKSRTSRYNQMKKNHVQQKGISHKTSTASVTVQQLVKPQKTKHMMRKRSAPKENSSQTASSDSSKTKKLKVTNGKAKIVKNPPKEVESASVQPAQAVPVVPEVEAKAAEAGVESSPENSGNSVPADSLNVVTAPPATEGGEEPQKVTTEETQKVTTEEAQKVTTEEKSKKPRVKREGTKEKGSSDSSKMNKKQQDANKKGDKRRLKEKPSRKDASKTPALKNKVKSKSVDQQIAAKAAGEEGATDVEGKAKEGVTEATLDGSDSSIPAATAGVSTKPISPPAAEQKSKKPNATKTSDPNKASKKRKNVQKEGDAKIVKKKCEARVTENSDNMLPNGQATREDVKTTVIDALAEYGKKPYMRPPPTAYLDEKYITMPKRRKELSFLQPHQRSVPLHQTFVAAILQRQRCANCFATFNTAEDLQSHIQLQKCSNDFGFDSDDEGNLVDSN